MAESILDSIKKVCGMEAEYTAFDVDMIMHINSLFAELNAIGIGPAEGFMITDNVATWEEYLEGEMRLNNVKSWMYIRTRLVFDPPATGPLVSAFEKTAERLFGYISIFRESQMPPLVPVVLVLEES